MTYSLDNDLQALQRAIAGLYDVFARYELRADVPGCPCCVSAGDQAQIRHRPLRELRAGDLSRFAHSALLTWGTVDDFKHFLPRLMECAATASRSAFVDPEILVSRLAYGGWHQWPVDEQAAVRRFLHAQWHVVLGSATDEDDAEDWLCSIAQAEEDLAAYLQAWAEHTSPRARELLSLLLINHGNTALAKMKLTNAFWGERRRQMEQTLMWLATRKVHDMLEEAFFAQPPGPLGEQFSMALTIQEVLAAHCESHPWVTMP